MLIPKIHLKLIYAFLNVTQFEKIIICKYFFECFSSGSSISKINHLPHQVQILARKEFFLFADEETILTNYCTQVDCQTRYFVDVCHNKTHKNRYLVGRKIKSICKTYSGRFLVLDGDEDKIQILTSGQRERFILQAPTYNTRCLRCFQKYDGKIIYWILQSIFLERFLLFGFQFVENQSEPHLSYFEPYASIQGPPRATEIEVSFFTASGNHLYLFSWCGDIAICDPSRQNSWQFHLLPKLKYVRAVAMGRDFFCCRTRKDLRIYRVPNFLVRIIYFEPSYAPLFTWKENSNVFLYTYEASHTLYKYLHVHDCNIFEKCKRKYGQLEKKRKFFVSLKNS